LARFPGEAHKERAARFLGEKHAQKPLDLVVPNGPGSLSLLVQYRHLIAPAVPIVYCCVTRAVTNALNLPSDVIGVLTERNWSETLALAGRLQPNARNLVVISGASEVDRAWQAELRTAIQLYLNRYNVQYFAGLPRDELLTKVSRLPRDTIVLLTVVFADQTGRALIPAEVAREVATVSAAPVYTAVQDWLGNGVVGGYLDSFDAQGAAAADLAIGILSGKDLATLPRETKPSHTHRVDARALAHWGLREAALPTGTIVSFKQPSLWEQHRNLVVAALLIFALQTAFVGVLLIQRSRRKGAESLLKESEERMTFTAASANIGLWQFDQATNELWATEHCRALFGLESNVPLTRDTFLRAVYPNDRAIAMASLREASKIDQSAINDVRVILPDGQVRWVRVRARTHSKTDAPDRLSGIFIDITDQKTAEAEAALQRQEVAHLMRVSVLGELSGAIAHEINQPLTAILSNAQAALYMLGKSSPDLAEVRAVLQDIVHEDNRAGEVIHRLRNLIRKGEKESERIDLNDLVNSTIALLNSELIGRRVNIKLDLASVLPATFGDPVQLQQVLLNLVMNAMDAMASTPMAQRLVTVSTHATRTGPVEVRVKDCGCGIRADDKGRLFEPFYTTKDHGLGLGLAICATIVHAHEGDLTLTNDDGGGAVAVFTLPAQKLMMAAQ
jgi:PAS domain S-box-containing protein